MECEAHQRHAEISMKDMGVDGRSEEVSMPGVSASKGGKRCRSDERVFRAIAA